MSPSALEELVYQLGKLPGLGPRSARRMALSLLKKREASLRPLINSLEKVDSSIKECSICGNLDEQDPCTLCTHPTRDKSLLCIVEDVADLWALERAQTYKGLYHILGGTLSALEGRGPEALRIGQLIQRLPQLGELKEIILALNATIEGQTTAHYMLDRIKPFLPETVKISHLAFGVPMGGELDYLDEGTLSTALKDRRHVDA